MRKTMFRHLDLSISQRLAIGFATFFLLFASVFAVIYHWYRTSERTQTQYTERIAPLSDQITTLERSTYRVAISLRSFLLNPTAERAEGLQYSIAAVRSVLAGLAATQLREDERMRYGQVAQAAQVYLKAVEDLASRRAAGPVGAAEETSVNSLRLSLLGRTVEFGELLSAQARAALDDIAAIHERTSRGVFGVFGVAVLLLAVLAWLTARSVSGPTKNLVAVAEALQSGDWRPALGLAAMNHRAYKARDEMRRLASAFGSAAVALESREQRLHAQARVSNVVASTLNAGEIATQVLQQVVQHSGAELGVVYRAEEGASALTPIAEYALGRALPSLQIGEGVPGEAARQKRTVLLSEIPADSGFRIKLGYDEAPPRSIVATPLLFRGDLQGVLLVASLREFSAETLSFLESSAVKLSVGLQNAAAYRRIQDLLAEVQANSERIQAQNEELQAQNEEMQAQNEEIQAQSQQLQVQHEEIQAQNEELLQQGAELRRHAGELAEADERKNKFLGVLAHELRNPMAPIANSIFILKSAEPGSPSALRAQAIIERQAAHLVRLIDDLLDVTRITEGKIHIQRLRLDLVDVVRSCVEDLATAFERADVALELDLPNAPVEVSGDRTRLCQVLGNLLHNSLKFTHRGGRVTLSLRVDHASGAAVLRVIDDGVGMEPELLPNLFQPFSQGVSGLARTNGGLGLGLALVKMLMTLHDGTVHAHSAGAGRGAEFTLRIPLIAADEALHREHASEEAIVQPIAAVRRVLLIEDHLDAASSLREALEIQGYHVAVAHSGDEGVRLAREFKPDVVFCDIGLPGQDGYETARLLRADPQTRSALLIALTGYASAVDRQQAHSAGYDLHLAKPLSITRIPEIINQVWSGRMQA